MQSKLHFVVAVVAAALLALSLPKGRAPSAFAFSLDSKIIKCYIIVVGSWTAQSINVAPTHLVGALQFQWGRYGAHTRGRKYKLPG